MAAAKMVKVVKVNMANHALALAVPARFTEGTPGVPPEKCSDTIHLVSYIHRFSASRVRS